MSLDTGTHLSALTADSQAFADLAAELLAGGRLDRPVAACPGWDIAALVGHLGGVYSWVRLIVDAGGQMPSGERAAAPADPERLVAWFQEQRDGVVDALTGREPDEAAWTFIRGAPGNVGWWRRRQSLETAVHLWDLQDAAGSPAPVAADLAADGIDEYLATFLPGLLRRQPVDGLAGTFHVHCTDAEGEWVLDFGAEELGVRREHAKADTAARGPASGLYLWLWNRVPLDAAGIEVFGDEAVARAIGQVRL